MRTSRNWRSPPIAEESAIRLRVALIGPVPPEMGGRTHGGVATHQMYLAQGLARSGRADIALLATNTQTPSPARAVRSRRALRYLFHVLRYPVAGSRREVLAHLLWYAQFLESARPEVIHVQHPLERHRYARLVQRLEPRLRHIPVVVTAHSLFGEHAESTIDELMAPNLRTADRVIAVSPHIAEQAIQLGVEPERVRVIRSGIDLERFRPRDRTAARRTLGLDQTTPIILFVGNLEPRKQVDVLLRAVRRLHTAQLVVIGTGASAGSDDQTSRLQQLVHELQLESVVRLAGRVSRQDLEGWYAAADVFALPSSSEAQGMVALEAMASGLPVVASAVGGLLGTIDDGRTGYLIPSGDVEALATRLAELISDRSQRARIGSAARESVAREFSWDRAVSATLDVYTELVGCRAT